MTQDEKQLLLKDLSARLPYKPMIHLEFPPGHGYQIGKMEIRNFWDIFRHFENGIITTIKPYLRPMSSMTDAEKKELEDICTMYNGDPSSSYEYFGIEIFNISRYGTNFESDYTAIDWLNSHHFDYRGLIEKGLALEAPEGMYN